MTKLRILRKKHNQTLDDVMIGLANQGVKTTASTLGRCERYGNIKSKLAIALAKYYGVGVDDIIG